MLTEDRQREILELLNAKGSVTLQELKETLAASESTIRRDITQLAKRGELVKVFGGAVKKEETISTKEQMVSQRMQLNLDAKIQIAKFAASLISPNDFVFIDAGTTTGAMIPYITETSATFVTNAVSHAIQLVDKGFRVIMVGGELKAATQALVGNEAVAQIGKFYFTKAFIGTNGISEDTGFTTPDVNEAFVKEMVIGHSKQTYILADSSKFHQVSPVQFCAFDSAEVITEAYPDEKFEQCANLIIAER